MAYDVNQHLTLHFQLKEFLHNGSLDEVTPDILQNLKALAEHLEDVRKLLGNRAIHITSGFRTVAHNREVGGRPKSYHQRGLAADFVVAGMSPQEAQHILDSIWIGGMEYAPTWIHLDLGPKRRFHP